MSDVRFNPPPGWPDPPAGWAPSAQWQPESPWPEAPIGWQFWVAQDAPRDTSPVVAVKPPPRANGERIGLTALVVLGPLPLLVAIQHALGAAGDNAAVSAAQGVVSLLTWVGYLVVYALLARRVSYRPHDTFFQLIPFYGLFWLCRITWRFLYLPHCDWSLRPEERPWLQQGGPTSTPFSPPPTHHSPPGQLWQPPARPTASGGHVAAQNILPGG